ncbi:urease accessory protein UreF [Actinophytocola xanthii]|uniref:Urease accessory protein UreF n=1 Tax=Actinophytocola xanthii TaxID=1912961 RepID=A0A1Q8CTR4_9PSEU|nr:urease accessory UreF family protein [Actinophytocola xanthii]OLF17752.1 urease accessory protein UreF [Actinophytocola xanthii]
MSVLALMLADSRFPGGGHAHSGGLEEAAARGLVRTEADLPAFLSGRLRTAGVLAAVFAAAAAHSAAGRVDNWSTLDEELDARTPSSAQRSASRAQGRATARAAAAMAVPSVDNVCGSTLRVLLAATPRPHHAIVLGAVIASPPDAALVAAYLSVSGPASASVRLLGLDPLRVNGSLAALEPLLRSVAADAAASAALDPAALPAPGAPALDLLAEEHDRHHREEVRLFAS